MSAARRLRLARVLLPLALTVALSGCYREKRQFNPSTPPNPTPDLLKGTPLRPGPTEAVQPGVKPAAQPATYEENAYAVSQGKRLFRAYNCSGCHGQAGGNMGPPLMDDKWLYGSSPAQIFATITEGRPNGMPSFGGRIAPDQLWQLVAYVRSMSGQLRKDVAPSRGDALAGAMPENERAQEKPVAAKPSLVAPPPAPVMSAASPPAPASSPLSASSPSAASSPAAPSSSKP